VAQLDLQIKMAAAFGKPQQQAHSATRLQVTPVGAMTQNPMSAAPAPVEYAQAPAYAVAPPPQPGYYAQPYHPPLSIGLGFGNWDHRRWR